MFAEMSDWEFEQQRREIADAVAERTSDPKGRQGLVEDWLDKAETNDDFAKQLDRFLVLPTDSEVEERRKSLYFGLAIAGFAVSIVSIIIAIASAS